MPREGELAAGWDCHVHVFDASAAVGASHYQPAPRPLADIEALAQANGCGHLVLVQASVYGTDNSLLLRSVQASRGRHRGVVVLDGDEPLSVLQEMHTAGVRGVRFNLVSPVGSARDEALIQLGKLAPACRALGWHVQWYVQAADLALLAQCQSQVQLPFVLDHLAGMTEHAASDESHWRALEQLAFAGAWIKLSGWYRLQALAPYETLLPVVRRVAEVFGERMLWGSDWPHTSFAPDKLPSYESMWQPVVEALGAACAEQVRRAGALLYT